MPNIPGKWSFLFAFATAALPPAAVPADAAVTKAVAVTGRSTVYDGDVAAAFETAKRAALRSAVEEALGVLISARTRVVNFTVIDDDILAATQGYVRSFRIVEHGPAEAGDLYEVSIEATVDLGDLQADLQSLELLWEESGRPRLVCVGGEYVLSEAGSSRVEWGTLCRELAAGLADLSSDLFLMDGLPGAQTTPGDTAWASGQSVRGHGGELAEILVVATASLQANRGLSVPFTDGGLADFGIQSVVAEVAARVQWSDTGQSLGSSRAAGRGADTSFRTAATAAIADAVPHVAAELGAALVEELRARLYDGRLIEVVITAENPRALQVFESEAEARLSAVDRLYPRARTPSGEARYEARSKATAFDLAREITAKGLGEMSIEIVRVTTNTIALRLSP